MKKAFHIAASFFKKHFISSFLYFAIGIISTLLLIVLQFISENFIDNLISIKKIDVVLTYSFNSLLILLLSYLCFYILTILKTKLMFFLQSSLFISTIHNIEDKQDTELRNLDKVMLHQQLDYDCSALANFYPYASEEILL